LNPTVALGRVGGLNASAGFIVNVTGADVDPPVGQVRILFCVRVTETGPGVVISAASMVADAEVSSGVVAALLTPLKLIVDPPLASVQKAVPVSVSVNPLAPAVR
jgi:hypothetical protein